MDFDGTLSDIAARPDLARPLAGAPTLLAGLAIRYAAVAVVTGRPEPDVRALLDVEGVRVFGLYGLDDGSASPSSDWVPTALREEVERVAAAVPGTLVEDKGPSVAVHFRTTADPSLAERLLKPALQEIAARFGVVMLPGKLVLELAPRDTPGKGAVILREAKTHGLKRCLFAGDDRADMKAFAALDALRSRGIETLKVAVRSEGTPKELMDAADVVVDGPVGLAELLGRL